MSELAQTPRGAIVLGMGRGGTSMLSGLLAGAGFSLGGTDAMTGDVHNALGYFELTSTVEIDDRILARAGGTWYRPPTWAAVDAVADELRPWADDIVDRLARVARPDPLVIKDPRISMLMPVWSHLVGTSLLPVVIIRNPTGTARSLVRRDGMAAAAALALWEVNWRYLLRGLNGTCAYVVCYEELLAQPASASGLLRWLAERLPPDLGARVLQTSSFPLRHDLHRNRPVGDEVRDVSTSAQYAMWEWLSQLPRGEMHFDAPDALVAEPQQSCFEAIQHDANVRGELAVLRTQNNDLQAAAGGLATERRVQEETIERQAREIAELRAQRAKDVAALAEAEALENDLAAKSAALTDVYASRTWRVGAAIVGPLARIVRVLHRGRM